MRPYYSAGGIDIFHGDALEIMASLPSSSVALVASDPPYFQVVEDPFDHQWPDAAAFLAWIGRVADEWQRLLTPAGSFYAFASPKMAARVELVIAERLDVLNTITWAKPATMSGRANKEGLRAFFPDSERIIFGAQRGSEGSPMLGTGYAAAEARARSDVFAPLREYLVGERDRAGVSNAAVDAALKASGMASHYFGASQWAIPTAAAYRILRDLCGPGFFEREFDDLRREYQRLWGEFLARRAAHDHLRRTFNSSPRLPFRDVWTHAPFLGGERAHVCEKPLAICRDIVELSSLPGDLVLDSFIGSGSMLRAAKDLGRRAIGIESEERWCEHAAKRLAQEVLL